MDKTTNLSRYQHYTKALIPDIMVNRSRPFKSQIFESEYNAAFGKFKDNPKEKYFQISCMTNGKTKPFSDNNYFAIGTNKYSSNCQGYTGIYLLKLYIF